MWSNLECFGYMCSAIDQMCLHLAIVYKFYQNAQNIWRNAQHNWQNVCEAQALGIWPNAHTFYQFGQMLHIWSNSTCFVDCSDVLRICPNVLRICPNTQIDQMHLTAYWLFPAQRFYLSLFLVLGFFYTIQQISISPTSLWHQFFKFRNSKKVISLLKIDLSAHWSTFIMHKGSTLQ